MASFLLGFIFSGNANFATGYVMHDCLAIDPSISTAAKKVKII